MNTTSFWEKLVAAVPTLPYIALGLWMAWTRIAYNGVAWISTPDLNGETVSTFYIISTAAFALTLLAMGTFAKRLQPLYARPSVALWAGLAGTLASAGVIAVGPYIFQTWFIEAGIMTPFYYGSCVLAGISTAVLFAKSAGMYRRLLPRNAIVQLAFACLVMVGVYFTAMGFPDWRIAGSGPLIVGTIAFLLLPLLCGFIAWLDNFSRAPQPREDPSADFQQLPKSFWKLTATVAAFAFAASMVQAYANYQVRIVVLADQSAVVLLFQAIASFAFIALAVAYDSRRVSFGRIFTGIMVVAAFFVVLAPTAGVYAEAYYQTLPFATHLLEFMFWCMLFFTMYQRHLSALLVLGFGYGSFTCANALGWMVGTYAFPALHETTLFVFFCIALSFITLAAAFILFSEKEFDRLFEERGEELSALSDLMSKRLDGAVNIETHRGRFNIAIDFITDEFGLSKREKEVLRYLAMGYESTKIAETIGISWNTVRTHTRNLYSKLDLHTRQDVVDLVTRYKDM